MVKSEPMERAQLKWELNKSRTTNRYAILYRNENDNNREDNK